MIRCMIFPTFSVRAAARPRSAIRNATIVLSMHGNDFVTGVPRRV